MRAAVLPLFVAACLSAFAAAGEPDVLIADFEAAGYGSWKAEGEAFGPGPAAGTLPNQMAVSGFEGRGLVNSFWGGDSSTGTLTSPPFAIQRRHINFLIGGGMHPQRACINLLVDGRTVRTATGPNDKPGGSERLEWQSWDVADLLGQTAVIQIVDQQTGGWGHINIDHIVQSERSSGVAESIRDLPIDADYLNFCFAPGQGGRTQISLSIDGEPVRQAVGQGRAKQSCVSWDVSQLRGKTAQLRIAELPDADGNCPLAASVALSDEPRGVLLVVDKLYQETYRPQFHFTPAKNWMNDPNGLVYYAGEYHLFFQHNPESRQWGNMTWGHALSTDLVHWKQLEHAIYPDQLGTIFSGSAVVDHRDTAGFQSGDEKPIVCMYTSAGKPFTQSLAYSNDRGRTWTKYAQNPVLGHIAGNNRDPKVIWHQPSGKWVMALYLDKHDFALFGSPNLKDWTRLCDVPMPGSSECPDFFPLAVDGDPQNTQWLFWTGNGNYRLGSFDGQRYEPETEPLKSLWGANDYAAQTYSDIPKTDGRRIQIAWMNGGQYPDMPFNQQMSFPRELTLRNTDEGPRLHMLPVREIESLRGRERTWSDLELKPEDDPLAELDGELWDIHAVIEPREAAGVVLSVRGEPIRYDTQSATLHCRGRSVPLPVVDGAIELRVLVDRTSIEIFANGGRVVMCSCFLPDPADRSLGLAAQGAAAKVRALRVHELRSAW